MHLCKHTQLMCACVWGWGVDLFKCLLASDITRPFSLTLFLLLTFLPPFPSAQWILTHNCLSIFGIGIDWLGARCADCVWLQQPEEGGVLICPPVDCNHPRPQQTRGHFFLRRCPVLLSVGTNRPILEPSEHVELLDSNRVWVNLTKGQRCCSEGASASDHTSVKC